MADDFAGYSGEDAPTMSTTAHDGALTKFSTAPLECLVIYRYEIL